MILSVRNRLRVIFLSLFIASITTLFIVIAGSLETPISLPFGIKLNVNYLAPQGWAFFTRDAREEKVILLAYGRSGKLEKIQHAGFHSDYSFGLNRQARKIQMEYSIVTTQMDSLQWIPFKGSIDSLSRFAITLPARNADSKSFDPKLCGEVIVVKTKIIPWAWAKFDSVYMPSKVMKLYVICPTG